MWYIRKIDPLDLIQGHACIAFTGGGGKTSFIELLARRTAARNKKTAIVTTTKMYARKPFLLFNELPASMNVSNPIQIGNTLENGKITALSQNSIKEIRNRFDVVLIEADGANRKPLKYPARHEPVIPDFCGMVCVLAGLDGLLGDVRTEIFRFELLNNEANISVDAVVSPDLFSQLFTGRGLLKGTENKIFFIVLNKFDTLNDEGMLFSTAKKVIEVSGTSKIILSSIAHEVFYEIEQLDFE